MTKAEPTLPSNRAFVVQFRVEEIGAQPHYAGRVEHVVSRQVARFDSAEELLAFMASVLVQVRAQAGSKPHGGGA